MLPYVADVYGGLGEAAQALVTSFLNGILATSGAGGPSLASTVDCPHEADWQAARERNWTPLATSSWAWSPHRQKEPDQSPLGKPCGG